MNSQNKKPLCVKCKYFDALNNCDHCEKCFAFEMRDSIKVSNAEIFKVGSYKNFYKEVN